MFIKITVVSLQNKGKQITNKMEKKTILLTEDFLNWEWWGYKGMVSLFIYMLFKANTEDSEEFGQKVGRGSLLISVGNLCGKVNLTSAEVRLRLTKLEETNHITIKTSNRYTIITVCDYEDYVIEEV